MGHQVRDLSEGLCRGQETQRMEEVEEGSHSVPGLGRSLHFGKGVPEGEVGLADWVRVGAFDVEDLADLAVVGEVRGLELLGLLDQP